MIRLAMNKRLIEMLIRVGHLADVEQPACPLLTCVAELFPTSGVSKEFRGRPNERTGIPGRTETPGGPILNLIDNPTNSGRNHRSARRHGLQNC